MSNSTKYVYLNSAGENTVLIFDTAQDLINATANHVLGASVRTRNGVSAGDDLGGDYNITTDATYPRIALSGGLYASRVYTGSTINVNEIDWDFKLGGWHLPPYTTEEYDIGYNNGESITAAINLANSLNKPLVTVQPGEMTLAYHDFTAENRWDQKACIRFTSVSNIELNFTKTHIRVIFDSDNRSPYDEGAGVRDPWEMRGYCISGRNAKNIRIIGSKEFPIEGDTICRSFIDETGYVEDTYCCTATVGCYDWYISFSSKFFCADAFASQPRPSGYVGVGEAGGNPMKRWTIGTVDSNGDFSSSDPTTRITEYIDIRSGNTPINETVLISTSAYTRYPEYRNPLLSVAYYDDTQTFIRTSTIKHLDDIPLGDKVKYLRFMAFDDERTGTTEVDYGEVWLVTNFSGRFILESMNISNNRRGGISNVPNDTILRNINISEIGSGGDLYDDGQHYPGTTVYYFNQEDTVCRNLLIDCVIARHSAVNGMLINNLDVAVTNCDIDKNIYFYSAVRRAHIDNCVMKSNRVVTFLGETPHVKRYIKISNTHLDGTGNPNTIGFVTGNDVDDHTIIDIDNCSSSSGLLMDIDATTNIRNFTVDFEGQDKQYTYAYSVLPPARTSDVYVRSVGSSNADYKHVRAMSTTNDRRSSRISVVMDNDFSNPTSLTGTNPNGYMHSFDLEYTGGGRTDWSIVLPVAANPSASYVSIKQCSFVNFDIKPLNNESEHDPVVLVFHDCELKNTKLLSYLKDDTAPSDKTYIFKNCSIDCTGFDTEAFILSNYGTDDASSSVTVRFINCAFIADSAVSLSLISASQHNTGTIDSTAVGCSFVNVTNTDGVTTIS